MYDNSKTIGNLYRLLFIDSNLLTWSTGDAPTSACSGAFCEETRVGSWDSASRFHHTQQPTQRDRFCWLEQEKKLRRGFRGRQESHEGGYLFRTKGVGVGEGVLNTVVPQELQQDHLSRMR